jgi:hypothetical protein
VVTADQIIECSCGSRAITILQASARSKGLSVPQ